MHRHTYEYKVLISDNINEEIKKNIRTYKYTYRKNK